MLQNSGAKYNKKTQIQIQDLGGGLGIKGFLIPEAVLSPGTAVAALGAVLSLSLEPGPEERLPHFLSLTCQDFTHPFGNRRACVCFLVCPLEQSG